MATEKAKSAVVVTPKVAKITKSDITNAILAQSLETKVDLLLVTANSENLNKFTKDALVAIVKVANPKFEVLKKTTKGEIIPVIMKADDSRNLENVAKVIFTEENLMKLTKDVLENIVAAIKVPAAEITPAAETSTEATATETATEDAPTPTDAVITDESSEVVADETATETTETIEA